MDFLDALEGHWYAALEILNESSAEKENPRILHLQRLLRNVVANLQALMIDIEAGRSWSDLGFQNSSDLAEILDGFELEISSLKSMIQNARAVSIEMSF